MEKEYVKERVLNFNWDDWKYEISSGFSGYKNINKDSDEYGQWLYSQNIINREVTKRSYKKDYKPIYEFRGECLPFG